MTTYQMVSRATGADIALVKSVSKRIIGNRHHISTKELHTIIHEVQKEVAGNDSIAKGIRNI